MFLAYMYQLMLYNSIMVLLQDSISQENIPEERERHIAILYNDLGI